MLPEADIIRLRHMLEAAREAVTAVTNRSREHLARDRFLMHAVVRCIEIVGEAAANVSDSTKERLPQIPWKQIVAMRNHLAHGCFTINLDIVWKTVSVELPGLINSLREFLDESATES